MCIYIHTHMYMCVYTHIYIQVNNMQKMQLRRHIKNSEWQLEEEEENWIGNVNKNIE